MSVRGFAIRGDGDRGSSPVNATVRAFHEATAVRLRGRFDEIVATILEAIRREVADYGALVGGDEASIETGVRATTDLFLRLFAENRELDHSEVEVLETLGKERARQGIPLESFQAAVRVGVEVGLGFIAEEMRYHAVDDGPAGDATAGFAEMLEAIAARAVAFVHQVQVVIAVGYRLVERERLAVAVRGEMGFVDLLVEGAWADDATIATEADLAAVALSSPCGLLVVVAEGGDCDAVSATLESLRGHFDRVASGSINGGRHAHAAVFCSLEGEVAGWTALTAGLDRVTRAHGVVVFAERVERPVEVADAYQEIVQHLDNIQVDFGVAGVVDGCELAFLAACGSVEHGRAGQIVGDVLGGFFGSPRLQPVKYLETLDALARRADKKDAARTLGVTVSTLQDRVARIRKLTGYDPNLPADAFRLRFAATLYRFHASALPDPVDSSWRRL